VNTVGCAFAEAAAGTYTDWGVALDCRAAGRAVDTAADTAADMAVGTFDLEADPVGTLG